MNITTQPTTPLSPVPDLPPLTGNARADAAALCEAVLLARPAWRLGAQGPDAFDCWGMLALLQKHLFGREVEIMIPRASMSRAAILRAFGGEGFEQAHVQWRRREGPPQHGDGVLMSHKQTPHHCGTWLDLNRGVVAHHAEHAGFSLDGVQALRLSGYTNLTFYEWVEG